MASYSNGRVNVSQYLRNLNVQEPAVEETFITDEDLEKDLALFTNTQFFDFETGRQTDYQAPPVKPEALRSPATETTPTESLIGDFSSAYDFPLPGDFGFGDYSNTFASPTIPAFPDTHAALGNHLQPIQHGSQAPYAPAPVRHQQPHHSSNGYVPAPAAPTAVAPPPLGAKRKSDAMAGAGHVHPHAPGPNGRVLSFEEASRLAAEEDKRRRNTAASARFRIKKKQREQALERSAKEMSEKVTILEGRISALETENKWLKSLVTEKHGGREDIIEKLLKEVAAAEAKRKEEEATNGSKENKEKNQEEGQKA
ncbi:hypothetical protein VTJ83DRAFT_6277 [Remersonia thermophila]|uniref:BZIP domain-containing protein n=1 Tax=Remersonia thermophila TaxID=72144 RepID=A0ABR4D474_9PEZI